MPEIELPAYSIPCTVAFSGVLKRDNSRSLEQQPLLFCSDFMLPITSANAENSRALLLFAVLLLPP